jgi:polysaccharide deacetylase family protein (PEP-CTERM system associated)
MLQRIFTIDFETICAFSNNQNIELPYHLWDLEKTFEKMQAILETHQVSPTFFILSSTAEKYPKLVKQIAEHYDIGTHSYNHNLINTFTIKEFSQDLKKSIDIIEQLTGKKVNKYRAPGFSLPAIDYMEQLIENVIETDCSLTPINHFYGNKTTNLQTPYRIQLKNGIIKEFPITTFKFFSKNIGFTGGGYFRLYPYSLIKHFTSKTSYLMAYIHLSDIEPNQAKIKELSLPLQFRRMVGIKSAERKLRNWLNDFEFVDVETANETINWEEQPIIKTF